jgi:hypothetical protein
MATPHCARLVSNARSCARPTRRAAAVNSCRTRPAPAAGSRTPLAVRPVCPPSSAAPSVSSPEMASHFVRLRPLHHRAAVVALVGNRLLDSGHVHPWRLVGPQLCLALDRLRHCHPGLAQRLIERGRVALIDALQRDHHHRPRVQIHRVLGLVRQMRPPSFIFAIRASPSAGLFHSLFDVRFLRLGPTAPSLRASAFRSRGLRQPAQRLLVTLARVAPDWIRLSSLRGTGEFRCLPPKCTSSSCLKLELRRF